MSGCKNESKNTGFSRTLHDQGAKAETPQNPSVCEWDDVFGEDLRLTFFLVFLLF